MIRHISDRAEQLAWHKQFREYLNLQGYCLERLFCRRDNNEIYEGVCRLDGKPVAVKRLHSNDPYRRERFLQEIDILRALSGNPNVVRIMEWADWRGTLFHVCEWVQDRTDLFEIICDLGLPLREKLLIMADLAKIVAGLHRNNVAHGDLTPDNVLVNGDCEVRLIDFGAAEFLDRHQPEDRDLCILTDVYNLGLSLCHLLLGIPNFQYGTTSILAPDWVKALEQVRKSGVERDLLLIVERAFYANPEIRPIPDNIGSPYLNMEEAAGALAQYTGKR